MSGAAVPVRVLHQIDHRAAQFGRVRQQRHSSAGKPHVLAHFLGIVDDGLQQCQHVHALARAGGIVSLAQVVQRSVDQSVHLGQILAQTVAHVVVLDALDAQAHARQRRAQIVRHRRQEA